MKINGIKIKGKIFTTEGCHKFYIIENYKDLEEMISYGYNTFYGINKLEETYNKCSCELKFISKISGNKIIPIVEQFKNANFN